MTNKEFVQNAYPDAKILSYFINDWYPCVHSYECGEMLDECIGGWRASLPPKNDEDAWSQAARYIQREMLRKLES
jgi:hypothetical protein